MSVVSSKWKEDSVEALKKILFYLRVKSTALITIFENLRGQSDIAVNKDMFEEAPHALADDDFLTVIEKLFTWSEAQASVLCVLLICTWVLHLFPCKGNLQASQLLPLPSIEKHS